MSILRSLYLDSFSILKVVDIIRFSDVLIWHLDSFKPVIKKIFFSIIVIIIVICHFMTEFLAKETARIFS